MSTNLQIITDALRSINVIDETETPSAEQGSHCLRQMNQMLAEWAVDGIVLGSGVEEIVGVTASKLSPMRISSKVKAPEL